jgi:hypothetical protein
MVSKLSNVKRATKTVEPRADEVTVYGHLDAGTLAEVDRVADQMMMPRSWVVGQICKEWAEQRSAELNALEASWNGSYRELMSRHSLEAFRNSGAI